MPQDSKKYTRPTLRKRIKEEIEASDKGGKAGQWSARKSQLLASEYKKRGGAYTSEIKGEAAKSLEHWTDQEWQTIEGEEKARDGPETKRYLPKAVWEALSDSEKREAERTKTTRSRQGRQYVPWTRAIQNAFDRLEGNQSNAEPTRDELYAKAKTLKIVGRSKMTKAQLRDAIAGDHG